MSTAPKNVFVLAFANHQLLDVTGPLQVFASANDRARGLGLPLPYHPRVIASPGGATPSSSGLALLAEALPALEVACDTLIIAGGWGVYEAARDPQLVAWVAQRAATSRRVASVCTGAFLLAASGWLDGRRVVTHWTRCEQLAEQYPQLQVEPNPIFINDGPVWTSAGVTAGIDLALALVEADLGREAALDVARQLVVFLKRPGGQSQFSVTLSLQNKGGRFDGLHAWIAENLSRELTLPTLARQAGMSERSFVRHYRADTGQTPARAIEQIRVETARRLLADTGPPIKRIAAQCGFGSEETLRRSLLRALGVTPQAYRERFAATEPA
ncbi:transcriptional regulator, AraC family with amidase-like domain [Pseudomonas saponiphila]|uniref:Transcriptional regulator, AraC family with amidase-like domain n=1 Tax=Pseudomonas saponiphila TaxID=556534 RepID=A0A1H4LG19_9PSED|nr:GlxA family transcriptional regulator [Pseudomonas saponiphila]SEB69630.1 transcriptional regulator, AraC family with amidase-like domain [Pseudomonas saponiphila]